MNPRARRRANVDAAWLPRRGRVVSRRGSDAASTLVLVLGRITLCCFAFHVAALLCAAAVLGGCARLGERVQVAALPPGAPDAPAILDGLAHNDAAIQNFKAKGSMSLTSPDFAGVKTCDDGLVAFRRPDDLSVIGKKLVVGIAVFRITSVGKESLIEFPATPEEEPYYSNEGEQFGNFSVSPSDIAREMFLPEDWRKIKPNEFRLTAYDEARQEATIEIGTKRAPRRMIVVTGPPWRVIRSTRLDKDGGVAAITAMEDYREIDGVQFPAKVDATFPGQQTRMTISMRKIWTNTKLEDALFDVKARAREAGVNFNRPSAESRSGAHAR